MVDLVFNGESLGEFGALPEASQKAILSRVAGHFNNESASAKIAWARGKVAEGRGNGAKAADISTDDARAYSDANPDAVTAFITDWFAAKRAQIIEGTLGVRTGGGSADPLAAMIEKIAVDEVRQLLGKSAPRGTGDKATKYTVNERDGTRTSYVGHDGLVQFAMTRWLKGRDAKGMFGKVGEANEGRIEALAKRALAQKAKEAARRIESTEADDLGIA